MRRISYCLRGLHLFENKKFLRPRLNSDHGLEFGVRGKGANTILAAKYPHDTHLH
jgi:hypothetical protein